MSFASVVLDVDSTLSAIEGIDWLARRRGTEVEARVVELTERAMRGEIPLDAVYGERLGLVRPSREEIRALGQAYVDEIAPGAVDAIARLRQAGRRVVLVSGGLLEAIHPLARHLGVPLGDVNAVSIRFGPNGDYDGFDAASPLATAEGKRAVVEALGLPRPVIAVGDGATDLAMRPAVDAFAAFTGFARREAVVAGADCIFTSFDQLAERILA